MLRKIFSVFLILGLLVINNMALAGAGDNTTVSAQEESDVVPKRI